MHPRPSPKQPNATTHILQGLFHEEGRRASTGKGTVERVLRPVVFRRWLPWAEVRVLAKKKMERCLAVHARARTPPACNRRANSKEPQTHTLSSLPSYLFVGRGHPPTELQAKNRNARSALPTRCAADSCSRLYPCPLSACPLSVCPIAELLFPSRMVSISHLALCGVCGVCVRCACQLRHLSCPVAGVLAGGLSRTHPQIRAAVGQTLIVLFLLALSGALFCEK